MSFIDKLTTAIRKSFYDATLLQHTCSNFKMDKIIVDTIIIRHLYIWLENNAEEGYNN